MSQRCKPFRRSRQYTPVRAPDRVLSNPFFAESSRQNGACPTFGVADITKLQVPHQSGSWFAATLTVSTTDMYPSLALLSHWSDHDWERSSGVQLEKLAQMDRLVVRTYQQAYEIIVHHGHLGDIFVRGGRFFQDFTNVRLTGSSMGSGFLKQLGIYIGLRMEFSAEGETILTAPVLSISIAPLIPGT